MQVLDCPRCRARFRAGVIYVQLETCPRCGEPFGEPKSGPGSRLRRIFERRAERDPTDWETITGSQYSRRPGTEHRATE